MQGNIEKRMDKYFCVCAFLSVIFKGKWIFVALWLSYSSKMLGKTLAGQLCLLSHSFIHLFMDQPFNRPTSEVLPELLVLPEYQDVQ